jgi:hypothetical protein
MSAMIEQGNVRSMKRLGVIAVIVAVAFIGGRTAYPSATLRYRLTLETELNGQLKSGSGVIEVSYSRNLRIFGGSADITIDIEGDAVSVDLGKDDGLFALLAPGKHPRSGPEYIIPVVFGLTPGGIGSEDIERIGALDGRRDVPFELLPLIVRLRNVADPKSAESFDPLNSLNRELKLTRAAIEIVSAGIWPLNIIGITGVPITRGITSKLPWLTGFKGYSGGQLNPDRSRPEKNLTGNDFIKGVLR